MPKFDVDLIKQAASGRWPDLLSSLASLSASTFDGKHQPCPKCGGSDRFRAFPDFAETGGCVCNQCGKFNDGLAVLQWLTGSDFQGAATAVADRVGVKPKGKSDKKPDDGMVWETWASGLVGLYLNSKPGVKEAAMQHVGGRMARYKRMHSVVAFPVVGSSLDVNEPVNYVAVEATGGKLPTWGRNREPGPAVSSKVTGGKTEGLLNPHAIERLLTPGLVEVVWKVEGITDLLSLQGIIPPDLVDRHVVVTNAFGAGEKPGWMAAVLAKAGKVYCIGDADDPGQAGAMRWARDVSTHKPEGATVVKLPYQQQPDHGKDLRDFVVEGHGYDALLSLADNGEVVLTKRDEDGNRVSNERTDTHFEREICRALQIEVLGELDGKVKIYSCLHHKSELITDISRMSYARLIQLCGPVAKEKVHVANEEIDGSYRLRDVLEAIALVAGYRRIEEGSERGAGVWLGKDLDGSNTNTLVLVNSRSAARYNGDKKLRHIHSPRVDGLLLDLSASDSWFDFDTLSRHLDSAQSPEFCEAAVAECNELFGRWRWRNQETDPQLVTGLVMATWVQSIWSWRPLVSVEGESNAGKSLFMQALGGEGGAGGLFGSLALSVAKPSEAGLRQAVGSTACAVLIDEFEKSRERERVLEMLRTSSRGTKIVRGSATQKAVQFGLQHIVWVAAIEAGLTKQADRNRFVQLELLKAEKGKENMLRVPPAEELEALGQRLLAVAIVGAHQAKEMAAELKQVKIKMDPRIIESYAVPAAMTAAAAGLDLNQAKYLLQDLLKSADATEQSQNDADDLLGDIFSATVHCGGSYGNMGVGQILRKTQHIGTTDPSELRNQLERVGIKVAEVESYRQGEPSLFICPRIVQSQLLKHSEQWHGSDIRKILLRLSGAEPGKVRLSGRPLNGVLLPGEVLEIEDQVQQEIGY